MGSRSSSSSASSQTTTYRTDYNMVTAGAEGSTAVMGGSSPVAVAEWGAFAQHGVGNTALADVDVTYLTESVDAEVLESLGLSLEAIYSQYGGDLADLQRDYLRSSERQSFQVFEAGQASQNLARDVVTEAGLLMDSALLLASEAQDANNLNTDRMIDAVSTAYQDAALGAQIATEQQTRQMADLVNKVERGDEVLAERVSLAVIGVGGLALVVVLVLIVVWARQ